MDDPNIKIEYQRDNLTYSGVITRELPNTSPADANLHFTGWEFRQILRQLHLWMGETPVEKLQWIRRDVPPHKPYWLEPYLVELIRVDPVSAIRIMCPPPVKVNVRDKVKVNGGPTSQTIRVGYDTIADSFGDWVYLPCWQAFGTSCLHCGQAATVCIPTGPDLPPYVQCLSCNIQVMVETLDDPCWVRIKTEALLNFGWDKFYISRPWNLTHPWISLADLTLKYQAFVKEKEACSKPSVE